MIERNARDTLKQWAEFVNAHQGKPLTPKDLNQAIEFYRMFPWLSLEVRRDAELASVWAAALHCSLLPNLRDILMVEAERKGIDPRPLVGAFDLLAKVGEAVEDLPRPEGEQPENARWPDEFYGWPDSFDEMVGTLPMDARRCVREAEAIFEWLRVKVAGEQAEFTRSMSKREIGEALDCEERTATRRLGAALTGEGQNWRVNLTTCETDYAAMIREYLQKHSHRLMPKARKAQQKAAQSATK